MKKQIISFVFLIAFSCISCNSFLDRDPLDQLSENTFYKTAEDANLATLSMYSAFHGVNWHGKNWMILEIPSDNSTTGGNDPDFSPIDNFTISPDNGPNVEFWTEHFKLITLANQVINKVPAIKMDEKIKSNYIAEARFLRAFAYFDLVRIYGEVPIIKVVPDINTDVKVKRDPVADVYNFLIEDLKFGVDNLPLTRTTSELGRATADAANSVLAKVYLTLGKYDQCMAICRDIIASKRYKLVSVENNWLRDVSDNNAESILQLQYVGCKSIGNGNALQAFFAPWGQGITKNSDGWGSQIPTSPAVDNPGTTIKDVFTEKDKRKVWTFMAPLDHYASINAEDGGYTYPAKGASRSGINIKKYIIGSGADVCFMSTPQNYHVIRYADVLLMLAEASTVKGGGNSVSPDVVAAFNEVRTRAGLDVVSATTTTGVFDERRREFAFENQRWFDLLRTGKIQELMQLHGKQMQPYHKLFPIPSQEIAINPNLTQNEGY